MQWLWTWGGTCFGYRDRDILRTYDGKDVGRFHGDDVYGTNGKYLGELRNENRLITDLSKKHFIKPPFAPYVQNAGYARYASYAGYGMYAGYEDFPQPERLGTKSI